MQAIVIRDTGEVERLSLPKFEELQRACGGSVPAGLTPAGEEEFEHMDGTWVESPSILASRFRHLTMWCNEEARNLGMMPNHKATMIVGWWEYIDEGGMLVGDVVITGPTDREGGRTALPDREAAAIEEAAANIVLVRP